MEFEALAQSLLGQIRFLLPSWLPGGKFAGNEYKCGSLKGGSGDSLSVNLSTGVWADFAVVGIKGGDLISLYAAIENLRQSEAFRILSERHEPSLVRVEKRKSEIIPSVAPSSSLEPEMRHKDLGLPVASWKYKDTQGNTLFYVARYEDPHCECGQIVSGSRCTSCGRKVRKELLPWCWVDKQKSFRSVGWPAPRPIYGLEQLGDKPIMIVEGEKTCESARKIVGDQYTVVTWPNGTNATKKVDWSSLSGRKVVIWPDADEVGVKAAYEISSQLAVQCPEVKIIQPEGKQDGWDAADALSEGWDYEKFIEWAKPRVRVPAQQVEIASNDQQANLPSSVYGMWEKFGIALSSNGTPICNVDNVLRVFEGSPEFVDLIWYDEFHKKYFTKGREWSDIDELNMVAFFQRELGISRMSTGSVHDAAMIFAHKHPRNEPLDWLKGLVWDGIPRIESTLFKYFGCEKSNYTTSISHNFWVGLVARVYSPGTKVDNMAILEGGQGKFKSTALSVIGGKWYTESSEYIGTPNFYQTLMGKLIVEFSELDAFKNAENSTLKRVISCSTDRLRLPYAKSTADFPRQCVFVGTTNERTYLKDSTGARRFWPVKIGHIDIEKLKTDREQLFAEAVRCLQAGETWWEMPEEAMEEQERRRQADEWEPFVEQYLIAHPQGDFGYVIAEIAKAALNIYPEKLDRPVQNRIGKILRVLGYENVAMRRSGLVCRVWKKAIPF